MKIQYFVLMVLLTLVYAEIPTGFMLDGEHLIVDHRMVLTIDADHAPLLGRENPLTIDQIQELDRAVKDLPVDSFEPLFTGYDRFTADHRRHQLHQYYVLNFRQPVDIPDLLVQFAALEGIAAAEPDYRVTANLEPNDPYYDDQWAHNNTGQAGSSNVGIPDCDTDTEEAWDLTQGDAAAIVAILDTGVNGNHVEFSGKMVPGYDFVNNDYNANDDMGHGTSCAGISAARGNNGTGIAGVSWESHIMPVKVLNSSGSGSDTDIADGVTWATDNDARVVSMSLSGGSYVGYFNSAINYAVDNGTAVFAATGNDNNNVVGYPSRYENCIAVGALSPCNERKNPNSCDGEGWWGSNYGEDMDFLAPGVLINTTTMSGGYTSSFNGTSSACPHAAGIAALLFSINPDLTPQDVRMVMRQTADDLYGPGFDTQSGTGRLNAFNALNYVISHPEAFVDVDELAFQLNSGQTDSSTVLVVNVGEADLQYGIDSFGYNWNSSDNGLVDYFWLDISGSAQQISFSHNDQAASPEELPFAFPFYDENYTDMIINPNGWVGFGYDNDEWQNSSLPDPDAPHPAIMAYWDDLNPINSGNSSQMSGDVWYDANPERAVIWFDDVVHWGGDGTYDFQIVLYPTGQISFNYRDMSGDLDLATIGIQGDDIDNYILISYNQEVVHDELTFWIQPRATWLTINPLSAIIEPNDAVELVVTVDAAGLPEGSYFDWLVMETNDFAAPQITIPIYLDVTGGVCMDWQFGDLNQDGIIDVMDIVIIVNIVTGSLPNPEDCQIWASDVNEDGDVNVMDIITVVNMIVG